MLMASCLVAQADIGERRQEQAGQHGEPDQVLHDIALVMRRTGGGDRRFT